MIGHSHLAVIEKHSVHFLDGAVGGVLSLKVDKSVAFRSVFITHHLERRDTRENIDPQITFWLKMKNDIYDIYFTMQLGQF